MTAAPARDHGRHAGLGRGRRRATDGLRHVSVIACDAEAGIERDLRRRRPRTAGRASACCSSRFSRDALEKALANRVGQCVMTCPTTACYNGLARREDGDVGGQLRFFGDGWQIEQACSTAGATGGSR